jgi:hypothetical protein
MAFEDPVGVRLYMCPSRILPLLGEDAPAASFFSKSRVEDGIFVPRCRDSQLESLQLEGPPPTVRCTESFARCKDEGDM